MKKIFNNLIILFTLLLMFGCAQQEQIKVTAPQKTLKPSHETKTGDAMSQPKESTPSVIGYEYNPQGRRDPFSSLIVRDVSDKKKDAGPLEQDDIKTIRLIAIVWSGNQYNAMITLPDGKSYTVKKGMRIGMDGGTIESITKDSIVVRQLIKDKTGALKPKDIILRLRTEEQG